MYVAVGYNFFNLTDWDVCDAYNIGQVGGELGFLTVLQYLTGEVGKLEEYLVGPNDTLDFNDGSY